MIDPMRHLSVFDPDAFGSRRVDIIGAGATGSKVALSLAKLGVRNLHVWDFDKVEAHNVANQVYGQNDIGQAKISALQLLVQQQTACELTIHDERVDGSQEFGTIVFLLTDSMLSRREIWEKGIRWKQRTRLMIETRIGADTGRVYTIDPCKLPEINGWESTLYDDIVADVSPCGASVSVGPTSGFTAELAVWQLVRWFALDQGKSEDELDHEILFSMRPMLFLNKRFQ